MFVNRIALLAGIASLLVVQSTTYVVAGGLEDLEIHLVNKVDGTDPDENLIEAQEWLDGKSSLKRALSSSTSQVKTFNLLASVLHGEKCSSRSYKILDNNRDLVANKSGGKSLPRLRAVYDRVAEIHGQECASRIMRNEERMFDDEMDMGQVYLVNDYTDAAMNNIKNNEYMLRHNLVDYNEVILRLSEQPVDAVWNDFYNNDDYPADVLKAMQRVTRGTDDETWTSPSLRQEKGSFGFGKEYMRDMYKKYIVRPCEYYIDKLSDIYNEWERNNKYYQPDLTRNLEFSYHMYRFRICKHLIQNDKERLFKAILKQF